MSAYSRKATSLYPRVPGWIAPSVAQNVSYYTALGAQLVGDSRQLLAALPEESVDLIVTSPPFALLRKKSYGNENQEAYVDWLVQFGLAARSVLKPTGSLVLDLGGAYERGRPVRSLYPYRVLISFVDDVGYYLAEDFFWFNPSKLPTPIEWVNKRKVRAKDAVDTVWWFSKSPLPKADIRNVLRPYQERMLSLLENPGRFYRPKVRPSGHDISSAFSRNNGGALPSNLLSIPNTDSNSFYLRTCKRLGIKTHPARFPAELPRFFIRLLTDPDDLVLDIFSGSNTTGYVAEQERRRWLSMELDDEFAQRSAIRFLEGWDDNNIREILQEMTSGPVRVTDRPSSTRGQRVIRQ